MTLSAAVPLHPSCVRRARGRAVLPALVALAAWGLAGGLAAAWGWRLWGQALDSTSVVPPPSSAALVQAATLVRALGGDGDKTAAAPLSQSSDPGVAWRLHGVVADSAGRGVVLLASDGQRARPYRAGAELPDGWRVQRIERDGVWLVPPQKAQGGEAVRLPVPVRPAASAPPAGAGG